MVDINSPLGRMTMAEENARLGGQQGQRQTFTVDDGTQPVQQAQAPQRRRTQRQASLSQDAQQFAQDMFNEDLAPTGVTHQMEFRGTEALGELKKVRNSSADKYAGISAAARQRVEILAGLGRVIDECDIEGTKFTMRSLKTVEEKEILKSIFEGEDSDRVSMNYKHRINALARAVTHIDGQPINLVLGSNDISVRIYLFSEMDEPVTDYMYKWFEKNIVEVGVGKFKLTQEDVEGLVEDVKK